MSLERRQKQTATNRDQIQRTTTGETKSGVKEVSKPSKAQIKHNMETKTGSVKTKKQYRDI